MSKFGKPDILKALKQNQLFAQFEEDRLSALIGMCKVVNFAAEETIIYEGTQNDTVYFLLEGQVAVWAGGEHILSYSNQGDLIGEMSVISKNPTSAAVIASAPSTLFTISNSDIRNRGNQDLILLLDKIFLDILIYKLIKTTDKAKDFEVTQRNLNLTKEELAQTSGALSFSTGILESVLASMSDAVAVINAEGQWINVNPAFYRLVGLKTLPTNLADWPEGLGLRGAENGEPLSLEELPILAPGGVRKARFDEIFIRNEAKPEGIWVEANSSPLHRLDEDELLGLVLVIRDITQKKKEEEALIRAKEEAENMAKAKTNLLSVMSHELRTPLNGVLGMAQLLEKTQLNPEQKDHLQNLMESGEALFHLVANILDLTQIESGVRLNFNQKPLSVSALVTEIWNKESLSATRKGVDWNMDLTGLLADQVVSDAARVGQILRNLLNNAVKFSERGTITLKAWHQEDLLYFEILDQGIGMEPKEIESHFHAFSQKDVSFSRKHDGLGIGLALSRQLARRLGGDLRLESRLHHGTKAIFFLPAPAIDEESVSKEVFALDTSFAARFPYRILVAEDNQMNQKLILKVLGKLGYAADLADNGFMAVEKMKEGEYNLILMDLQMPDMDGIEAARVITGEMKLHPVIIALTANATAGVEQECYAVGMLDYMNKPLKLQELADKLAHWGHQA